MLRASAHRLQRHGHHPAVRPLHGFRRRLRHGKCYRRHRAREFPDFLKEIDRRVPEGLDVRIVMDNDATHKTVAVKARVARRQHWHVDFTPTSSSWIDQVERRFAELTRKQLQRGMHTSTRQLEADIRASGFFSSLLNRNDIKITRFGTQLLYELVYEDYLVRGVFRRRGRRTGNVEMEDIQRSRRGDGHAGSRQAARPVGRALRRRGCRETSLCERSAPLVPEHR